MRKLFALAILFLFAHSAACLQEQELSGNSSIVSQLVRVNGNVSFPLVIPGFEYASPLRVEWAVPQEALVGISAYNVTINVSMRPAASDSGVFFTTANGTATRLLEFQLFCILANASCAQASLLSQEVEVRYRAVAGAQYPRTESIVVTAAVISQLGSLLEGAPQPLEATQTFGIPVEANGTN
ncbi:MAG: hypothetical protein AABW54_00800, partial [Candidatus Micrarchaeota archaeon]